MDVAGLLLPPADAIAEARQFDGVTLQPTSALFPRVLRLEKFGLLRLQWLTYRRVRLRFVSPTPVPRRRYGRRSGAE